MIYKMGPMMNKNRPNDLKQNGSNGLQKWENEIQNGTKGTQN